MSVYVFYGRMNPFTIGHEAAVRHMVSEARKNGARPVVILSHTVNANKNPLTVNQKMSVVKKVFPNINVISTSKNQTITKVLNKFGSKNIKIFLGSNRFPQFEFLEKYSPAVKRVQFGATRTNNGVSATKARTAARSGSINNFRKLVPSKLSNQNLLNLMKAIQKTPVRPSSRAATGSRARS